MFLEYQEINQRKKKKKEKKKRQHMTHGVCHN